MQGCPEKQQQMLFSPGNKTQLKYHLHFKMKFYLAENMLSWRIKKGTLNLKGAFTLKNALTFTQKGNN